MAATLFGQLRGEFLLLLFEIIELYFYELVMLQDLIKSGEELRAETFLADLERCLKPLGLGFEIAYLRVAERVHCTNLRESVLPSHEEHDLLSNEAEDGLTNLLVPYSEKEMAAHPVSTLVNNPKCDDPPCRSMESAIKLVERFIAGASRHSPATADVTKPAARPRSPKPTRTSTTARRAPPNKWPHRSDIAGASRGSFLLANPAHPSPMLDPFH